VDDFRGNHRSSACHWIFFNCPSKPNAPPMWKSR